jgi:hypothetical protein
MTDLFVALSGGDLSTYSYGSSKHKVCLMG